MKKVVLLSVLLLVAICFAVYADGTATSTLTPKSGKLDFMSGGAVAVTDQTNGYTQRVDSAGAASVMAYPVTATRKTNTQVYAYSGGGVAAVSGACRLYGLVYGGPLSSAGDYLLVYDAASATGTPVFDVSIGTAKDTKSLIVPNGVTFSTGVFAVSYGGAGIELTVLYDQ